MHVEVSDQIKFINLCIGHGSYDTISLRQWFYFIINLSWLVSDLFIIYSTDFMTYFWLHQKRSYAYLHKVLFQSLWYIITFHSHGLHILSIYNLLIYPF